MEICRVREGFDSVNAWIVSKIRAYLAMSSSLPQLRALEDAKVADDTKQTYGGKPLPPL